MKKVAKSANTVKFIPGSYLKSFTITVHLPRSTAAVYSAVELTDLHLMYNNASVSHII